MVRGWEEGRRERAYGGEGGEGLMVRGLGRGRGGREFMVVKEERTDGEVAGSWEEGGGRELGVLKRVLMLRCGWKLGRLLMVKGKF